MNKYEYKITGIASSEGGYILRIEHPDFDKPIHNRFDTVEGVWNIMKRIVAIDKKAVCSFDNKLQADLDTYVESI